MAKGSRREGGGIGELLAYAGDRKCLTYLGMASLGARRSC